jgi:hypothetical protein
MTFSFRKSYLRSSCSILITISCIRSLENFKLESNSKNSIRSNCNQISTSDYLFLPESSSLTISRCKPTITFRNISHERRLLDVEKPIFSIISVNSFVMHTSHCSCSGISRNGKRNCPSKLNSINTSSRLRTNSRVLISRVKINSTHLSTI